MNIAIYTSTFKIGYPLLESSAKLEGFMVTDLTGIGDL